MARSGYAVLLRGINLGARNRVAMPDLRRIVADCGGTDVRTHLQSGNAVFRATGTAPALERHIAAGIHDMLGLDIAVLIRSADELRAVRDGSPFSGEGVDTKRLHVTFCDAAPDPSRLESLSIPASGTDRFAIAGREIHLDCPGGYGRTKLQNALWERKLGVVATTRNWNTVTALCELLGV